MNLRQQASEPCTSVAKKSRTLTSGLPCAALGCPSICRLAPFGTEGVLLSRPRGSRARRVGTGSHGARHAVAARRRSGPWAPCACETLARRRHARAHVSRDEPQTMRMVRALPPTWFPNRQNRTKSKLIIGSTGATSSATMFDNVRERASFTAARRNARRAVRPPANRRSHSRRSASRTIRPTADHG